MTKRSFWDPPSDRVAELIREAVNRTLDNLGAQVAAVDEAALRANEQLLAADPRLADAVRASTRANFSHWATANYVSPGMPVAPYLGPENVDLAREVVRHGLDDAIFQSFHAGQRVAVEQWSDLAFELTDDPAELREFVAVATRSIFAFVDDTLAGLYELIERERGQITDTTHVARLEVVSLVLEGAPITSRRASERLRYELGRRHTAAVIWGATDKVDATALEQAADALARAAGEHRALTVLASPSSLWVWVPSDSDPELDLAGLRAAIAQTPDVRVAIGPTGSGMDGFRRSHLDAAVTQRLMRRLATDTQVATYDDVETVALAIENEERANEFVARTLGALASAAPELRETLRVYLREESNTTATAQALYAHRNTVLSRLARARDLLPGPLEGRGLQIALALEIVHVLGAPNQH